MPGKIHKGTHFIFWLRRYNIVPDSSMHGRVKSARWWFRIFL